MYVFREYLQAEFCDVQFSAPEGFDIERVIGAFYALGLSQRALDLAVDHAGARRQFGRPIGDFQMVQAMLADMYTDVETMRALTYQLGREIAQLDNSAGGRGTVHKR